MKDSIGRYLDEIGTVALLDKDQERELAQLIEAGRDANARLDAGEHGEELVRAVREGARAKDHFIRANLRLVVSLARRYPLPQGMDLGDLVQEGNIGLEHAVDKFDWRKGFKFSTYAAFWIRQSIGRALDQKGSLVRLPGDRPAELRAALRANGGEVEHLDATMSTLYRLATPTSLDRPVGDSDDETLGGLVADRDAGPEQLVVDRAYVDVVIGLLDRLGPRARHAVSLRVGLEDGRARTLREVGEELGISPEAARRIINPALDELRVAADELGLAA